MNQNQFYLGNLSLFDYKINEWEVFYSRLTQFIKLNNITKASQSAVLLTHLSDESYRLVRNLVHPNKLEDCAYSELVEVLNRHFTPKRSTFADRAKFYEASRSDGESIEEWAARLRGLAVYCDFGTELDTLMRDRFVLGFRAGPERDKLFECDSKSLTFGQAVEVAQKAACARQARVIVKEEPVFRVNEQRSANPGQSQARSRGGPQEDSQRCNVCGLRFHSAEKCRFRNLKCNVCGLKGHLKKMCKAKKSNLHNIGAESDTSQGSDCRECDLFNMRYVDYSPIKLTVNVNNRAMETLLSGLDGVSVWLDDVCITGPTKEIHLSRLKEVLGKLQEAGLRLQKDKCVFFQNSVTYLGYVIDKRGLRTCPTKVAAILDAPAPSNVLGVKRFLGVVNYYRNFIPSASAVLSPLHELLRAGAGWRWGERQQAAFDSVRA
ncbi:uncharacterized protein LOC120636507 [Pararge aegeria]|uniref:uncharacterized protein LOC120636507 n=1 Tax=Pararge aegeria TaxID=116150 RepID=UPI0019D2E941|nr:uncharacterized protein LOC120636507 [Pararge aegeria]